MPRTRHRLSLRQWGQSSRAWHAPGALWVLAGAGRYRIFCGEGRSQVTIRTLEDISETRDLNLGNLCDFCPHFKELLSMEFCCWWWWWFYVLFFLKKFSWNLICPTVLHSRGCDLIFLGCGPGMDVWKSVALNWMCLRVELCGYMVSNNDQV